MHRALFFMSVVFFCMFGFLNTIFANERVSEGADLIAIRNLAIASPLYTQVKDAPTIDEVTDTIFLAGKVTRRHILSYDEVTDKIMLDAKINLKSLDRRQAAKIYREQIGKYADAYVIATVANNSRIVFFFDVFKSDTHELLYTYEASAGKKDPNTVEVYGELVRDFYKNFDRAAERQEEELHKK